MRDMLTSGENLVIDDDGTIERAGDPQFEDASNGAKAKTVPKAIVSVIFKEKPLDFIGRCWLSSN